jgi:hypothetical protein
MAEEETDILYQPQGSKEPVVEFTDERGFETKSIIIRGSLIS